MNVSIYANHCPLLLSVDAMWPMLYISIALTSLLCWTVTWNCERKQAFSPLSCFCVKVFCYHNRKKKNVGHVCSNTWTILNTINENFSRHHHCHHRFHHHSSASWTNCVSQEIISMLDFSFYGGVRAGYQWSYFLIFSVIFMFFSQGCTILFWNGLGMFVLS